MRVMIRIACASLLLAGSAAAQSIETASTVRVGLQNGDQVIGRLVASDSTRLSIRRDTSIIQLARTAIVSIERRATRAQSASGALAIIGAVAGAAALALVPNHIDCAHEVSGSNQGCDIHRTADAIYAGVAGGLLGGAAGYMIGSFLPRWRPIGSSVDVRDPSFGRFGSAPCSDNPSVMVAEGSLPHEGGHAETASLRLACEPSFAFGLEGGVLHPGFGSHTSFAGNDGAVVFAGEFVERRFPWLPFDPRINTGVGLYHGIESAARGPGWHATNFGGSSGFSPAARVAPHLSLRIDGRDHFFRGSIGVLSAGLQYRP